MIKENIKELLDFYEEKYNRPHFIENDPIIIPHLFKEKENIEIMGFWAAMLSWGLRKTIINKNKELIELMDGNPYDFILNHQEKDLKRFEKFVHRTFNFTDTLYFINFFKNYYQKNKSLETVFYDEIGLEAGINNFYRLFFSLDYAPDRTRKHVSAPMKNSACKRMNMFLRWMVRKDNKGVDFGIWTKISPSNLVCPCDVHVERIARNLKLIERPNLNWNTAIELTDNLKQFDANDPTKYDFALFGLGIEEKKGDFRFEN